MGIMRCLREAVRLKRPERWQNNDWILHVGNARPHTAHVVLQFLAKHSTIQIPHPPYSPDLSPNDFFPYPKLKMNLKGRKFDNVDMIQAESKATLRNLSKSDFISCFDNWNKYGTGGYNKFTLLPRPLHVSFKQNIEKKEELKILGPHRVTAAGRGGVVWCKWDGIFTAWHFAQTAMGNSLRTEVGRLESELTEARRQLDQRECEVDRLTREVHKLKVGWWSVHCGLHGLCDLYSPRFL
ncbi:hypothetical protein LAZ67_22001780 [Cordylochernes scorpioides]|uniref:Transposase n=1 Tax=Cordylochernes scorpioides TaxID=51811 RepID=A0ABY6LRM2_9ARAC|nr:hypothetical protein LAZ67_22001780 [Cordylochernes scorpioides]